LIGINWQTLLPGRVTGPDERQYWRLSTPGMAILRQSVDALSKECMKSDALSLLLSETLFLQLALMSKRFRHSPDSPYISNAEQLDLLLMALRVNISNLIVSAVTN
ncbi:AraC family transcriptional regulator, partial [Sodalis-like symbiont of Bactericera trigonica]